MKDELFNIVMPHIKAGFFRLLAGVVLLVIANLFSCALMFTSGFMISLAATIPLTVLVLHIPSIFVRIFAIGKPTLQYLQKLTLHNWVLEMTSKLRLEYFKHFAGISYIDRSRTSSALHIQNITDKIENSQNLIMRVIVPSCALILFVILGIVLSFYLDIKFVIINLVIFAICTLALPMLAYFATLPLYRELEQALSSSFDSIEDNISGILDWKISGKRSKFCKKITDDNICIIDCNSKINAIKTTFELTLNLILSISVICIILASVGALLYPQDSSGVLSALINYSDINASAYPANWICAFALLGISMFDILSICIEPAFELAKLNAKNRLSNYECLAEPSKYTFEIIGLNFKIKRGSSIAICGKSGVGKTTTAMLMAQEIFPQSGEIIFSKGNIAVEFRDVCFSYANAKTTSVVNEAKTCKHVTYISQHPHIFNATLRENIRLYDKTITDKQIRDAIEQVGLKDKLESLSGGLDSIVDESGFNYSGGEVHRIALARLLLKSNDVIVLDEPYASLDSKTAHFVHDSIINIFENETLIFITHDTDFADKLDQVIYV